MMMNSSLLPAFLHSWICPENLRLPVRHLTGGGGQNFCRFWDDHSPLPWVTIKKDHPLNGILQPSSKDGQKLRYVLKISVKNL